MSDNGKTEIRKSKTDTGDMPVPTVKIRKVGGPLQGTFDFGAGRVPVKRGDEFEVPEELARRIMTSGGEFEMVK